jgi:hypothetical protein
LDFAFVSRNIRALIELVCSFDSFLISKTGHIGHQEKAPYLSRLKAFEGWACNRCGSAWHDKYVEAAHNGPNRLLKKLLKRRQWFARLTMSGVSKQESVKLTLTLSSSKCGREFFNILLRPLRI